MGKSEATIPTRKAEEAARLIVIGSRLKIGKKLFGTTAAKPAINGNVRKTPSPPPSSESNKDSPSIKPIRCPAEKPRVLNTAYSRVL
jgi:hypothetical protein